MNQRELYASILLRRQRLIDTCRGLPKSILHRVDFISHTTNLVGDTHIPSLMQILNRIFLNEDIWLRVTLEHEQSVYPDGGFGTVDALDEAFRIHQGSLLLLTGMGPEGGWSATFSLYDAPEVCYAAEVIFTQFLQNEWRLWGMMEVLFRMNGIEPPIIDLI
jgi:hypothetical protein